MSKAICIKRGCGKHFDSGFPETGDPQYLRAFHMRYCPDHRVMSEPQISVTNIPEHTQDSDCTVNPDTNLCEVCGVEHGDACPGCGGKGFHILPCTGKPTLYSVGLYLCDRAYGGPEEGGWYYNCGELVVDPAIYDSIGCLPSFHMTEEDANEARTAMHLRAEGLNLGRREISSVASEGRYMAEIHEGLLPAFYPETKPRYE